MLNCSTDPPSDPVLAPDRCTPRAAKWFLTPFVFRQHSGWNRRSCGEGDLEGSRKVACPRLVPYYLTNGGAVSVELMSIYRIPFDYKVRGCTVLTTRTYGKEN